MNKRLMLYDAVRAMLAVAEVKAGGPMLGGKAIELAGNYVYNPDDKEEIPKGKDVNGMMIELLDYVYVPGKPRPEWLGAE